MSTLDAIFGLTALGLGAVPVARELLRKPMGPAARRNAPGEVVTLSQGVTHYTMLGAESGPVAVCVHGLTTPSFVWWGLAQRLGTLGFRVLVYDLYGRGYSDRPRGLQTPAVFARQLSDLLRHLELEDDITLIGYSMGGAIAAAYAEENHHRLRRLVLLAPAGMEHSLGRLSRWSVEWPVIGDWAFHMGFPAQQRRAATAEADRVSSVDDIAGLQLAELQYRGYVRSVLSSLRGTLRRSQEEAHREIARHRLPVVAIWGREDTVIPLRAMGTLTQWNRNVDHVVLDDAGHGLPFTHTDAVAEAFRSTWHGPVV